MKILCFGDSNTYGYDPRSFFGGRYPAQHRWVDLLGERLGCTVLNAGENGREIPSREVELLRFDRMLADQAPVDLLVVMLGGNDLLQGNSVEAVVRRMEQFLERIDLDRDKVLLIAPPPMERGDWVPTQALIDATVELNREYKSLFRRLGVRFADAGEWGVALTFDGVHFTEEGHAAFSEGLYKLLRESNLPKE